MVVPPFRIRSCPLPKIKATRMGGFYFWQRMRDSNPRERSQSPVCYRYTNPLYLATPLSTGIIIPFWNEMSRSFFYFFKKFSSVELACPEGLYLCMDGMKMICKIPRIVEFCGLFSHKWVYKWNLLRYTQRKGGDQHA